MDVGLAGATNLDRLYHYQPFQKDRVRPILTKSRLYMSVPKDFNDPWDCRPCFDLTRLGDPQVREQHIQFFVQADRKRQPKAEEVHQLNEKVLRERPGFLEAKVAEMAGMGPEIDERYRVYCLATCPDIALMWSHYARNHSGIYLEFSVKNPVVTGAYRVEYCASYPMLPLVTDGIDTLLPLITKSDDLAAMRSTPAVAKRLQTRFWEHRRPKHFTTGLVTCGGCNKPMAVIGKDYLGCNYARRRGTCSNRAAVRRSEVERLVLDGLKTQLMAPDLVNDFIQAFHQEVNRRRGDEAAERQARERELPAVNEKIRRLVDAIANGVRTPAIVQALEAAEARKIILELEEGSPPPTPVRLHPSLAELYRQRVADLHVALADASLRSRATEIIRSLVDKIVVTSGPKGLEMVVSRIFRTFGRWPAPVKRSSRCAA